MNNSSFNTALFLYLASKVPSFPSLDVNSLQKCQHLDFEDFDPTYRPLELKTLRKKQKKSQWWWFKMFLINFACRASGLKCYDQTSLMKNEISASLFWLTTGKDQQGYSCSWVDSMPLCSHFRYSLRTVHNHWELYKLHSMLDAPKGLLISPSPMYVGEVQATFYL